MSKRYLIAIAVAGITLVGIGVVALRAQAPIGSSKTADVPATSTALADLPQGNASSTASASIPQIASDTRPQAPTEKSDSNSLSMVITHPEYGFDISNTGQLVAHTNDVFIGTVVAQSGTVEEGVFSYPVFSVKVVRSMRGNATGVVKVVQTDVAYRGNTVYVSEGDVSSATSSVKDILLQTGATYVFVALYVASDSTYGISAPPYDRALIADSTASASLSSAQLDTLIQGNLRIQQLEAAILNLKTAPAIPAATTGGNQ